MASNVSLAIVIVAVAIFSIFIRLTVYVLPMKTKW
jgi:hypothetical protein